MSFTTASNYYNRVDTKFPVKGQDNDSQGFRDNWTNLVRAITDIDDRTDNLEKNAVLVENTTTNFLGNTIEDVNLRNYSSELYDNSEQYGRIEIDYTLANYQKIEVPQGDHQLDIINWPGAGKVGTLTLEITPTGDGTLNFIDGISLGPESNPFAVSNDGTYIFDLWREGGAENYFVKNNNALAYSTSTTGTYGIFTTLYIGDLNLANKRNKFTVNQGTLTNLATVVTRTTTTTRRANLALVPHRVKEFIDQVDTTTTPSSGYVEFKSNTSAFTEILNNATFHVPGSTVTFYVNTATSNTLFVKKSNGTNWNLSTYDGVNVAAGQFVTFTNPAFEQQDTVVAIAKQYANTFTGTMTNYIGNIYADKNRLEVTFDNFGNNNTNTFVVTTPAEHTVFNTSTELISAKFVHDIMPYGTVIMWYGRISEKPEGWELCDGSTYVFPPGHARAGDTLLKPDLRNRFVIGANANDGTTGLPTSSVTGISTSTGGSADAIIPNHSHTASATFTGSPLDDHNHEAIVNDPGHNHKYSQIEIIGNGERDNNPQAGLNFVEALTEPSYTGISVEIDPPLENLIPKGVVSVTVDNPTNGVDTTGKNIPPFYALVFLIKVTGFPTSMAVNIS